MGEMIGYGKTYREYKAELDSELQKTAEGFVRIGYLLKVARDTNILFESGYKSVAEFAEAEYNLDKTQVSRFISINDKFSEDGYSDHLLPTYQGFGYAKLTLMLQLPDAVNEALTPAYSKAEIQSIKEELDEERKVTDIEVALEAAAQPEVVERSSIENVIYRLGGDEPALFLEMAEAYRSGGHDIPGIKGRMAPAGEKTYSVRVPGMGRMLLMLNDEAEGRVVNSRTGEFEETTWEELANAWLPLLVTDKGIPERYEELYGRTLPQEGKQEPETAEVAPVQQKSEPKKEPKKPSKVTKARMPEPESKKREERKAEPEEQLPGQTDIEKDFPELMPEPFEKANDIAEIVEEEPMPAVTTAEPAEPESMQVISIEEHTETESISAISMAEQPEPEINMSNRERCRQALHRYIDNLDDEGIFNLIGDMEIHEDGILTCSACESAYGTENCHMSGECERRFMEWINR